MGNIAQIGFMAWLAAFLQKALPLLVLLVVLMAVARALVGMFGKFLARSKIDANLHTFLKSAVKIVLYFLVVIIVAGSAGLEVTSLVALVSLFGLAISMSVQGLLSNVANGIVLLSVKPFEVGDVIEVGAAKGTVQSVGLIHTTLASEDGKTVFIPNGALVGSNITNHTSAGCRRVELTVKIAYTYSLELVKDTLLKAAQSTPAILTEPAPTVNVSKLGDKGAEYTVLAWVQNDDYIAASGKLKEIALAQLAEAEIVFS